MPARTRNQPAVTPNPLPELPATGYEALLKSADANAQKNALHFFLDGSRFEQYLTWTYQQLLEEVHAAANLFHAYGLKQEETVSYILPNLPATVVTFFAGEARGIINPINPLLDEEHLAHIMSAANSKMLVTVGPSLDADLWAKVEKAVGGVPNLETVFTVSAVHSAGPPVGALPSAGGKVRVLDFYEELRKHNKAGLDFEMTAVADSVASCFHTGGTTGSPKLALRTHANELANSYATHFALGLAAPKVFLCGLPWFHANGTLATGMLPLYNGHAVVLATPAGYRDRTVLLNFWKIIAHFKINLFSAVPTILKALLSVPISGANLDSLELAICGAAPLSVQLFTDFQQATGLKILEGYGFTEGVCVNTLNPPRGEAKIGSIGLPLAHHYLKVAVLDQDGKFLRAAAPDEVGVFIARGTNIFPGYKNEADNKKAWVLVGPDKWYNTGDIGKQDADGYFWITGREKELIIRGGHNIDPKTIEEPLSRHPAVAAVAAVARPDAHSGELPVAYVELKKDAVATPEELMEFAHSSIRERAAVPKNIYILEQLPLTAVGKIFKPQLARLQVVEVYEAIAHSIAGVRGATVAFVKNEAKEEIAVVTLQVGEEKAVDEIKRALQTALGPFTIKYEIVL